MSKAQQPHIPELTWDEIYDWAGSTIARRGERYFKDKTVKNVQMLANGIIGTVTGGEDYTTLVHFKAGNREKIDARCNCPYDGGACKHAVALLLTASALKQAGYSFPIFDGDEDLLLTTEPGGELSSKHRPASSSDPMIKVKAHLEKQSKNQLISILIKVAQENQSVHQALSDQGNLSSGDVPALVESLKEEMKNAMSEPAWWDGWKGHGHEADFDRVHEGMQHLHNAEHFEAVIDLADELLEDGIAYIETCSDDGDSAMAIARCLDIAFLSIAKIDWPPERKLLWATDSLLTDQYGICEGAEKVFESVKDEKAWSLLADALLEKLSKTLRPEKENGKRDFSTCYKRNQLSEHIIKALRCAGRDAAILRLCEQEAKITGRWPRLVDELIGLGRPDDAFKRAEEGIADLGNTLAGVVRQLDDQLISIAKKRGDTEYILRLRQQQFMGQPSMEIFRQLQTSSKKTKTWDSIRAWAIYFLETGKQKENDFKVIPRKREATSSRWQPRYPRYNLLIEIAIHEKDPARTLMLYDAQFEARQRTAPDTQVANAIEEAFPERALQIWKQLAESQIAQTNPKAYESAVRYLKETKRIMSKLEGSKTWDSYLQQLQNDNKRRPRFLSELRRITGDTV